MDSNLFWCIIGIVGGAIASLFISSFFYFKGLTKKRLIYDIKTFSIISNKINQIKGLEVKYDSTEIENLSSSTIIIKNIGNSVVKEQDLAPLRPISVSTSGQFLKSKNEYIESHPINTMPNYNLLFIKDNYIKFKFDYIPKKAIITFSLFHTGDIHFDGELIEGEIITPTENQKMQKRKYILLAAFIYIVLMFISFLFNFFLYYNNGATR